VTLDVFALCPNGPLDISLQQLEHAVNFARVEAVVDGVDKQVGLGCCVFRHARKIGSGGRIQSRLIYSQHILIDNDISLTYRDNLEIRSFRCTSSIRTHKIHHAAHAVAKHTARALTLATDVTATAAVQALKAGNATSVEVSEDRDSVAAGAGCVAAMCELRF
jgi:hypothetical protein